MNTQDERPMSGSAFVLMTVLMVLGVFLILHWIFSTLAYLFNTLLLVAVLGGAAYLYLKYRTSRR
jgi:hypothetical protein